MNNNEIDGWLKIVATRDDAEGAGSEGFGSFESRVSVGLIAVAKG